MTVTVAELRLELDRIEAQVGADARVLVRDPAGQVSALDERWRPLEAGDLAAQERLRRDPAR